MLAKIAAALEAIEDFRMRSSDQLQIETYNRLRGYAFPSRSSTRSAHRHARSSTSGASCSDWPATGHDPTHGGLCGTAAQTDHLLPIRATRTSGARTSASGIGPIQEMNDYVATMTANMISERVEKTNTSWVRAHDDLFDGHAILRNSPGEANRAEAAALAWANEVAVGNSQIVTQNLLVRQMARDLESFDEKKAADLTHYTYRGLEHACRRRLAGTPPDPGDGERHEQATGVVIVLAVLSTGCTADVLGRMKGSTSCRSSRANPWSRRSSRPRTPAASWPASRRSSWRSSAGTGSTPARAWLSVTKDWFVGIFVCAYVLTTAGTAAGLERWIWDVGVYLGREFNPTGGFLMENFDKAVGRHAQQILDIQSGAVPNMRAEDSRAVEAIAWQFSSPFTAGLVGVNAMAIYLMKMVMQVSYAWLISFYWMMTPLVAPMAILPQTRSVFVGWLKTYISVALWPLFFAFAERLALAIPWSAWIGSGDVVADGWELLTNILQGEFMLAVFNIQFFFVYLSIPIASYLIVSGASRPFRML